MVCVFRRTKAPLVLREAFKQELVGLDLSGGNKHVGCNYVGRTYVHGIMHGEVFHFHGQKGAEEQFFSVY